VRSDLTAFGWFAFVFVNVHYDGDAARDDAGEFLAGNYRQDFRPMLGKIAIAGSPDEVVSGLAEFVEAGARHLVLTPATRSRGEDIPERIVSTVWPRVLERTGHSQVPSPRVEG
jgi:alkanesulfonate monooxygenase SsuD/methylene tetrahydromethanopterin reductase-like flavin-dependent oxidoreductase (luciferase family)